MLDLGNSFLSSVERDPDALAIVDGSVRMTYAQWYRRVSAVVSGFDELGLMPGDHLVTLLQNRWEAATIHWACQFAGIVITPINWRSKADEIDYYVENSEAKAIIFEEASADAVRESREAISRKRIALAAARGDEIKFETLLKRETADAKAAGGHRCIAVTANSMKPKTGGRAMSKTKKLKLLPIVLALSVASVITTRAQVTDYPNRPIQVIVPFAGGSASDVVTRVLLQEMSKSLGQNFIVENRPGAGGNTGTATAAKASPNGYTLVMSTSGPLAANKTLFKTLGYEPEKDFAPISLFAILPNVIVINSKVPPKTLTEFIAYAKAHPEMNYGSVGVGSSQHLAGVYFEQITGVQLTHVPYRNIAQYTPDFIAGAVPLGFQFLPNVLSMLQSGDARALAVTSRQRMTALPDVPTTAEAGLKNYETFGWLALLAPAGTPKPIIEKLYNALAEGVKSPAVRARFTQFGAEPVAPGPEEMQKFIVSETAKWRDIIQKAGIPPM